MSEKKNEEVKSVVVKEDTVVSTEAIDEKELKKAKVKEIAKKTGKILGIGFIGGILGYLVGSSKSKNTSEEIPDYTETIETDYEVTDSNEDQE